VQRVHKNGLAAKKANEPEWQTKHTTKHPTNDQRVGEIMPTDNKKKTPNNSNNKTKTKSNQKKNPNAVVV